MLSGTGRGEVQSAVTIDTVALWLGLSVLGFGVGVVCYAAVDFMWQTRNSEKIAMEY